MEALYQSVYAQSFSIKWASLVNFPAAEAAAAAVSSFSFATQDAVVHAKGQES